MATVQNPMASTWRNKDPKTWDWKTRAISRMDHWHNDDNTFPIFQKTDKIRWMDQWSVNRWILMHAAWPVAIHAAYNYLLGWVIGPLPSILAFGLYLVGALVNLLFEVRCLGMMAHETGFLDGDKHSRDKVPDVGIGKVLSSIIAIVNVRSALIVALTYRRHDPIALSWWIPAELFLYPILLDFYFYIYHRATHEIDGLWKYHRTHHLTKHPSPILSSYADVEQEFIEMALVPFLTFVTLKLMGFPMGFYDWWLCSQYQLYTEAVGHSGIRIAMSAPGMSGWYLGKVGCELLLEDHDLHHRQGWKKAGNYGKATRLWDRIFGTCLNRIESKPEQVDYQNPVKMCWL